MESSIGQRIEKLEGTTNWANFEYKMKAVWVMDAVWDVVLGRNARPVQEEEPKKATDGTDSTGSNYAAEKKELEKSYKVSSLPISGTRRTRRQWPVSFSISTMDQDSTLGLSKHATSRGRC